MRKGVKIGLWALAVVGVGLLVSGICAALFWCN